MQDQRAETLGLGANYEHGAKSANKNEADDSAKFIDTASVENMSLLFYCCGNLTKLDLSGWDTSNVKNMHRMFTGCKSLTELDLSGWDVSNVEDMSDMFYHCDNLTLENIIMDGCSDETKKKIEDAFNKR